MIRWTQRTARRVAVRPARGLMMVVLLVTCWAAGYGREGIGIPAASAQDASWSNPGTGDWTTPSNWNTGSVPTRSADISNGGTAVISSLVSATSQLTLALGNNSTGSLVIQNGGRLIGASGVINIATGSGSTGTMTVTGPGSQWIATNQTPVYVGAGGAGTLVVSDGGLVHLDLLRLAPGNGTTGTANITGPGSQLIVDTLATVSGGTGHGTLNVSAGGSASFRQFFVAGDGGSVGAVNVDGTGSSATATTLLVGAAFNTRGTLTLSNDGAVASSNTVQLGAAGSTATGTINIGAAPGSAAVLPGSMTAPAVKLASSTSRINFNHTATNYSFAPNVTGLGSVAVYSGTTALSGTNTYSGGTTISGGTIRVTNSAPGTSSSVGTGAVTLGGGTFQAAANGLSFSNAIALANGTTNTIDTQANTLTLSGAISDLTTAGALTKAGTGTLILSGTNTYSGGTFLNGGTLSVSSDSNLGAASGALTFNGGTLQYAGAAALLLSSTRTVTLNSGGGTFDIGGGGPFDMLVISSAIGGPGGLTKIGAGTLALDGTNTYGGATNINAGTLYIAGGNAIPDTSAVTVAGGAALGIAQNETIGSLAGAGNVLIPIAGGQVVLTTGADNSSTTFSGTMSNSNLINLTLGLTKIGTGTFTLSGANTYTGPTTVNGGTLAVNGSIVSSTTVNAGGTLGGNGTVGNTTINGGGALAPGNSIGLLTVQGNLVFTAASSYMVEVSPTNADRTNVTGTATLGGATVNANFAAGTYVAKQYTIVNATGSVNGTFASLVNTNLPGGFKSSLSYDANNAFLNLALDFTPPPTGPNYGGGLSSNQQNVANTLVNYFNTTGGIPMVYGTLTPAGLTQASGELATGSQQTTFDAMNLFLGLLTDPFMNRNGGAGSVPGAAGFAEEGDANAYAATRKTDAFAMFTKAPPAMFVPRWSAWAAGFGGSRSTSGNAIAGSNDTTSSIYSTAVGADYLFSPNTVAGFAIAGGGTNFSVVNSGRGRSDLFQAGAYIRHTEGAAYITAALAYGWQDITTNRTVTAAGIDQLRAEFNANTYSGRLEGGYRFVVPGFGGLGVTPYAAGQFTTFDLPAYAEQVVVGSPAFALAYAAKSVTDVRSELGIRTDKSFLVQDGMLTLRTRFAWAHDYDPDRAIAATFQALPGASFVVNGASQASDSALTTAAVEMKWRNGWSAAATFEGEFSDVTSSYAGKGVVRYAW